MEIIDLDVDFNDIVLTPSGSSPLEQIKASGSLTAAEIRTEGVTATDARGGIAIGDSKIALSDLGLVTPNAQLSLPTLRSRLHRFSIHLHTRGSGRRRRQQHDERNQRRLRPGQSFPSGFRCRTRHE